MEYPCSLPHSIHAAAISLIRPRCSRFTGFSLVISWASEPMFGILAFQFLQHEGHSRQRFWGAVIGMGGDLVAVGKVQRFRPPLRDQIRKNPPHDLP